MALPQQKWLKTTETDSVTVLEVTSSKSGYPQGCASSEDSRGESSLPLSRFCWCPAILGRPSSVDTSLYLCLHHHIALTFVSVSVSLLFS